MQLTRADAVAVHNTVTCVRALDQKQLSDEEMVNALFDNLYDCTTDNGIKQCVAVMPLRLWSLIHTKMADILRKAHPGELFAYAPFTPTASEVERLDTRLRHTVAMVSEYLESPTGVVEFEIHDPHDWNRFKQIQTVPGEPCRKSDCGEDRIRLGIYCREHHFEMIFGQPPL